MTLKDDEATSAAVAKSPGTRVSLAQLEANILAETYLTGAQFAEASTVDQPAANAQVLNHLASLTICLITLQNGFTVVGKAAPADPTNFDRAVGRQFAREDALRQVWPLMGYALREKLAAR